MAAVRDLEKARKLAGDELAAHDQPVRRGERSRHRYRGRTDRRLLRWRKELVLQGDRQRQACGHRQQGAAGLHGNEIFAAAQAKGVMVAFEAAVAGGIPIIKALREGLTANRIEWIAGIINGTSNFILTEMRDKGAGVRRRAEAGAGPGLRRSRPDLRHRRHRRRAQAHHHVGDRLRHPDAVRQGLYRRHLQAHARRYAYAEELGYRIKLLGIARRTDKGIELRVHPTLIPDARA